MGRDVDHGTTATGHGSGAKARSIAAGGWLEDHVSFGGLFLAGDRDADDPAVVDHVGADEALALEHGVPAMEPQRLGNQDESIARAGPGRGTARPPCRQRR